MREVRRLCGTRNTGTFWSVKLGKKTKEVKKQRSKGTCVEEVDGKKRKEGKKRRRSKGTCVEEKKRGNKKKEIWIKK